MTVAQRKTDPSVDHLATSSSDLPRKTNPWQMPSLVCHLSCSLFAVWLLLFLLFSCQVTPGSLWPHGLQHTRLPCPSPSPGAFPNSCPLNRRCLPFPGSLFCVLPVNWVLFICAGTPPCLSWHVLLPPTTSANDSRVLVSPGCCDRWPSTGWPKWQAFISVSSGGWWSEIQVPAWSGILGRAFLAVSSRDGRRDR